MRQQPSMLEDAKPLADAPLHIVVHSVTLRLECLHCHETYTPHMCEIEDYLRAARTFVFEHAKCRKVGT